MLAKHFPRLRVEAQFSTVVCMVVLMSAFTLEMQIVSARTLTASTPATETAVTTFHNDTLRTGQNTTESMLNIRNVNASQFGKRISYPVDGQVYAQPLVLPNVKFNGNSYEMVYVATEHDSVYAFNAKQTSATKPLWQTSFIHAPAVTTVPVSDLYSAYPNKDISPEVGITSTPVIDANAGRLYVVAMTKEQGRYIQRLHVLNVSTGKEMAGSPLEIRAAVPGNGYDSVRGVVSFNARTANQRAALLLLHGVAYIGWSSYGESGLYHGWVMGYAYDGTRLHQVAGGVYNDTPNGQKGGIWMGGSGLAADASGDIYFSTDDGSFDRANGGVNTAGSFVKLNTHHGLSLLDYFTPFDNACISPLNIDIGSSGVLLLPSQKGAKYPRLMIGGGKEGRIYVINRSDLGGFTHDPHLNCHTTETTRTDIDKVLQEFAPNPSEGLFGVGGYWSGTAKSGQKVYLGGFGGQLRAFNLEGDTLSSKPSALTSDSFSFSGTTPSISSNGSEDDTGIVWVNSPSHCTSPGCTPQGPGKLRAYDASDISKELYTSDDNSGRDRIKSYVKFSVPTVANGEVFVGTQNSLDIFGLLK